MKNLFKKKNGQGMVEYGLILALISIVATLHHGNLVNGNLDTANSTLDGVTPPAAPETPPTSLPKLETPWRRTPGRDIQVISTRFGRYLL